MRIVEVNTVCDTGSTGRIAADVARIAEQRGHDVFFAYGRGKHPVDIQGYKIGNKADFFIHVCLNFFRGKSGFGSVRVTKKFLRWLDTIHPDVFHLHNLHGFYINVELLFEYIKRHNIYVVWTLHDCWAFTGQCAHFDYVRCEKWKTGCYACPIYRREYPYSLFCDNSKNNYITKCHVFGKVQNITVVTPSLWLNSLVKESFLKSYEVETINNGIDVTRFRCLGFDDYRIAELKKIYAIDTKKVILGVANIWTKKKGIGTFCKLAQLLPEEYLIVLIGVKGKSKSLAKYKDRIIPINHTDSIEELVAWYNLADVFVNPTLEDNFPTTNIEALACGTPVITYKTGGSPEIVDSHCGIVVEKENINGLAIAIKAMIGKKPEISENCRLRVLQKYNKEDRLAEYVDLMESMVE